MRGLDPFACHHGAGVPFAPAGVVFVAAATFSNGARLRSTISTFAGWCAAIRIASSSSGL